MCLCVRVYACVHVRACVCVNVCWRVRVISGSLALGSARTLGPRAELGLMPRGVCKCEAGAFGVPRGRHCAFSSPSPRLPSGVAIV